jgi:hypothetical protein
MDFAYPLSPWARNVHLANTVISLAALAPTLYYTFSIKALLLQWSVSFASLMIFTVRKSPSPRDGKCRDADSPVWHLQPILCVAIAYENLLLLLPTRFTVKEAEQTGWIMNGTCSWRRDGHGDDGRG